MDQTREDNEEHKYIYTLNGESYFIYLTWDDYRIFVDKYGVPIRRWED